MLLAGRRGIEEVRIEPDGTPSREVSKHLSRSLSVARSNRLLAVGRGPALRSVVLLRADDSGLAVTGRLREPGWVRDLAWHRGRLFAAAGWAGLLELAIDAQGRPSLVRRFAPGCSVVAVAHMGPVVLAAEASGRITVLSTGRDGFEDQGSFDTADTPLALAVQGRSLLVAELAFPDNLVCMLSGRCREPVRVERFDLDETWQVAAQSELSWQEARVLFRPSAGALLVSRQRRGFVVWGEEGGQP